MTKNVVAIDIKGEFVEKEMQVKVLTDEDISSNSESDNEIDDTRSVTIKLEVQVKFGEQVQS